MISLLRRSLAAKLVAGGCVLALIVVGGVAGYLIYSRTTQTQGAAQSNADNRVGVMAEVLNRFTGAQSLAAATDLAAQAPLIAALSSAHPAEAAATLFSAAPPGDLDGEVLVLTDARGDVVYTRPAPSVASVTPISVAPRAVQVALSGGRCSRGTATATPGGCGIEPLSDGQPAYAVALPVVRGTQTVGAVAYLAPLSFQLDRFAALFNFPTAFVPAQDTGVELRPTLGRTSPTAPTLRRALTGVGGTRRAIYEAPITARSSGPVAGSFTPVYDAAGTLTGYVGVEVPLAPFVGDARTDVLVVALIAVLVLLVVTLAVVLFVERFVRRPIAALDRGVARIAGGDYATGIPVRSQDELGRLAANVDTMRASIAGYIREVEQARQQLDEAVEQVSGVSRALTTTTSGVQTLQQAVVHAAASIGGGGTVALLATRQGQSLQVAAADGAVPPLSDWRGLDEVLAGHTVWLDRGDSGSLTAVPMFYQDSVVGALATITPPGARSRAADTEVAVLAVLANNAAIAMENARLFEHERETVRRLLELDSLKTDFLSTVQHELRTPLTAIVGLADLLEMCWGMWDDGPKVGAVRDIQVAAKNLYDIVETIIEYSALTSDGLRLERDQVPLRAATLEAVETVAERYKGGLPVPVDVEGDDTVTVFANRDRLVKLLRAVIDNGVKFSDGRGRLRVGFGPARDGAEVRIEVTDEGEGIPPDDLPQVFAPFFQVDNSATRKHEGTGMGLALVKRVAAAHGARVELRSTVGQGTTVVLLWPATERSAGSAAGRDEAAVDAGPPRRGGSARPVLPVQ